MRIFFFIVEKSRSYRCQETHGQESVYGHFINIRVPFQKVTHHIICAEKMEKQVRKRNKETCDNNDPGRAHALMYLRALHKIARAYVFFFDGILAACAYIFKDDPYPHDVENHTCVGHN